MIVLNKSNGQVYKTFWNLLLFFQLKPPKIITCELEKSSSCAKAVTFCATESMSLEMSWNFWAALWRPLQSSWRSTLKCWWTAGMPDLFSSSWLSLSFLKLEQFLIFFGLTIYNRESFLTWKIAGFNWVNVLVDNVFSFYYFSFNNWTHKSNR